MSNPAAPEGGGLGGATFSLAIDSGSFDRDLMKAEGAARKFSKTVDTEFKKMGQSGAMSLLYLGQAVDDVQYGFRAIVNNIPQLAMAMGGGAGLAGVVGILAVGINQVIQHWEGLSSLWDSSAGKLPTLRSDIKGLSEDLDKLKTEIESLEKSTKEGHWFGPKENLTDLDKLKKLKELHAEGAKNLSDAKLVEAHGESSTKMTRENQAAFKGVVEQLPEGADTIIKLLMAKMSSKEATALVAEALRGKAWAMKNISDEIPTGELGFNLKQALPAGREAEALRKDNLKKTEEEERIAKEFRDNAEKKAKMDKAKKIEGMEEEQHQLELKRRHLLEAAHEIKPMQTFGGTAEMINSMQTETLNRVPKQQLEEAKKLNAMIEKIGEDIRKQRAKFG